MEKDGFTWGAPVFLRVFKTVGSDKPYGENGKLEVWVQCGERFRMFRSYAVCYFSEDPGPKIKEGDGQSPEGFYFITPRRLNPYSSFHLSFNLGYPNAFDRAHGRTGSALMVHGNCCSIGCYAMTNPNIEEIYLFVDAALRAGQSYVRIHVFHFPITKVGMAAAEKSQWLVFWNNQKEGYDYFEEHKTPPNVLVENERYVFKPEEVSKVSCSSGSPLVPLASKIAESEGKPAEENR